MVIAFLALLGVDLVVIVVFLGTVASRKRWVARQPGAFKGAIRVAEGEVEGIPPKWRPGYGRWVRDVFVWTKAPFLFRNELLPADGVEQPRPAMAGEVRRVRDNPVVMRVQVGGASVEVAASADARALMPGPYGAPQSD